jgi:magnesium transporter
VEAQPTPTPERGSVVHCNGSAHLTLERAHVEDVLRSGMFLWLDLLQPEAADLDVLRDVFGFHPLALEDSWKFGQRPKLEEYDAHVFLVVYGASPDEDRLVEVHCFYSEHYLVTIHRDEAPSLVALRERYARRGPPIDEPVRLLYTVVDGLVDSFFPTLAELDNRIDELEDAIFLRADDAQLREIFAMKRLLVGVRKVVSPQRDLFASIAVGASGVPGMTADDARYFRDVYDHLIRISDLVDTYRDLLTGAMDVYLSTVSNRLNGVMKQLAIIATVFMPLTFLTGFFGQNFPSLVGHIGGWTAFLAFGIALEVATLVVVLGYFWRRGWLVR